LLDGHSATGHCLATRPAVHPGCDAHFAQYEAGGQVEAVKTFIDRQEPEILEHFELVVNTVSMEEAVGQQESH